LFGLLSRLFQDTAVNRIHFIGNRSLRWAIQQNLVSFPSQLPALMAHQGTDVAERVALLYFVRGWPVRKICDRYDLENYAVKKMLSEWRARAVAAGYIQDIHPENLDELIHTGEGRWGDEEKPMPSYATIGASEHPSLPAA
jgi:hypothetical protein